MSSYATTFTVTNCASSSLTYGSLPWAVAQANREPLEATILFNIPTSDAGFVSETWGGYCKIELDDTLTLSHNGILISGESQSNTNPSGPDIEIIPSSTATMDVLVKINSANRITVEGLAIDGSNGYGVQISFGNFNKISKNYIGATPSGEGDRGNTLDGVFIQSGQENIIGGETSFEGNVIAGNSRHGVSLTQSTLNIIKNNIIGSSSNESKAIGNGGYGVYLSSTTRSNVILNNLVKNNGDATYRYGLLIDGGESKYNLISQNRFADNYTDGIKLTSSANSSINPPTISTVEVFSISSNEGSVYVLGTGEVQSIIEVFRSDLNYDINGGEGEIFVGSTEVDSNGNWSASFISTLEGFFTATQTDRDLNTSQFSINLESLAISSETKPDIEISVDPTAEGYTGFGIINSSGSSQTVSKEISAGETFYYYLKIHNRGSSAESFKVFGTGSDTSFEVNYYFGSTNITSTVTVDGWITDQIAVGGTLEVLASIKSNTINNISKYFSIYAQSISNTNRRDLAKCLVISTLPPENFSGFRFTFPSTIIKNKNFVMTIEALNANGEVTNEISSDVTFSVDFGLVSPESISGLSFGGVGRWTGEMLLTKAGKRRITATSSTASGSFEPTVYNGSYEASDQSLGVSLTIPEGSISADVTVIITETTLPGSLPTGKVQSSKVFELSSSVANLILPATVTIPIYSGGENIAPYYWTGSVWANDGLTLSSSSSNIMTFETTHFSQFVALSTIGSSAKFIFGPSPYSPTRDGTGYFWYWLDADQPTTLSVYNFAGKQIYGRSFSSGENGGKSGKNVVGWDGIDGFGEYVKNGGYYFFVSSGGGVLGKGKFAVSISRQ